MEVVVLLLAGGCAFQLEVYRYRDLEDFGCLEDVRPRSRGDKTAAVKVLDGQGCNKACAVLLVYNVEYRSAYFLLFL